MASDQETTIEIRLLNCSDEDSIKDFDCSDPKINLWLRKRCITNQEDGYTRTFGCFYNGKLLGFYSLCPTAVTHKGFFQDAKSAPDPVPCILLARLGVQKEWHRKGIGKTLLRDAFQKILAGEKLLGGYAIIVDVDSCNQAAQKLYAHYGFKPMTGLFTKYYLELETLRKANALASEP